MPSNVNVCQRHGVSVDDVDYFCIHCYYMKKGVCNYRGVKHASQRGRVAKRLIDLIDEHPL